MTADYHRWPWAPLRQGLATTACSTMRLLRWSLILLLLAAAGSIAWAWRWLERPLPLAAPTVELSIEPGATPREVANAWVRAGVRVPPVLLYEWFRWSGDARRIRAGSYVAGPEVTPRQLLAKMVQEIGRAHV